MTEKTIAFDGAGWPSFYSFIPEWMIGMRNKFYSFKGGNIYEHSGPVNTFYGQKYNSSIETVINTDPLSNKLFKTIGLHSTNAWDALLETDIQLSGMVNSLLMEKKEGVWFSYIMEYGALSSVAKLESRVNGGIGVCNAVYENIPEYAIAFDPAYVNSFGNVISVGDSIYFIDEADNFIFGGIITGYSSPGSITMHINVTINGGEEEVQAIPSAGSYIIFVKNTKAESSGLLGHYCKIKLECSPSESTELFAIESDVMRSYP